MMGKKAHGFDQRDLIRIDKHLKIIKEACISLRAISIEKGGIPTIESNIGRIDAALNILMTTSEVLEILEEEKQDQS